MASRFFRLTRRKSAGILDVFQTFSTQSGGKICCQTVRRDLIRVSLVAGGQLFQIARQGGGVGVVVAAGIRETLNFLDVRSVFLRQIALSGEKKFLALGHIANYQTRPTFPRRKITKDFFVKSIVKQTVSC